MAEVQEIYSHSSQKIYLDIYGANSDATPVATFSDGTVLNVVSDGADVPNGIGGQYHVDLNMAQTQNQGDISITWDFAMNGVAVKKVDYLSVVSPILSVETIKSIHPNATDAEVTSVEKAVRNIIQAHCGQEFGYFEGVLPVYGRGSKILQLPVHLLELNSVNTVTDAQRLIETTNGWSLHYYPWGIPSDQTSQLYLTGGVITDPYSWANLTLGYWENGVTYNIDGKWGYHGTPAEVAEAAKLLVNDYACGDNQYRDRFLTSMTAADWRIQFNDGAFANTGNVRADQLLQDYVIIDTMWTAI